MSNSWFKFKQFTIQQDRCGMKVSTDACVQGAWVPIEDSVEHVLDIGAGTGLLSLMLAQRNSKIIIDAIELDEAAAQQAKENVAASPWADRINVLQGDVRDYPFEREYDLIICNPPFFHNSLQSAEEARNNARHSTQLTQEDIADIMDKVLDEKGYAALMLPGAEHEHLEKLMGLRGWNMFRKLLIIPKEHANANRVISVWSKAGNGSFTTGTLQIRDGDSGYTEVFTDLLRPFYLFL